MIDEIFEDRLRSRLNRLAARDRLRSLEPRRGIDLSSNDYLGLSNHPAIRAALQQALADGIPLGATGSRLLRGNTEWHEALETRLAAFKGSEAALIFNSGYEANLGVLSTLIQPVDLVFSDALIHASMIDGIRASKAEKIIFPHNDMTALEMALAKAQREQVKFIVVESLYSMEGDRAPLELLADLAQRYGALLIVDEAHATGVFGVGGAGLLNLAGVTPLVAIHTCGKAWGASGAFISCTALVKQYLVNRCRNLIFTTAPPPLMAIQWHAVLDLMASESWRAARALDLAASFRAAVAGEVETGSSDSQIVPILCGSEARALWAAEQFRQAGFDIRAIRPPTVPIGGARLRLAFNARLEDGQVARLVDCCRDIFAMSGSAGQ